MSKNAITTRQLKTDQLVKLRKELGMYRPKSDKEGILGRIRQLERDLGLPARPYNNHQE